MLREVPGYISPITPEIMQHNPDDHFEPTTDALDDIFGSAPNSPLARAAVAENDDGIDFEALDAPPAPATTSGERSDIPRLRSMHVTTGYRDGIAESKAQFVQEGFDEGFSLGAVLGLKTGWLLGVLEGLVRAVNGDVGAADEVKGEVREEFVKAREELALTRVFGREYFGEDGIWKFVVEGEAADGGVTFLEVADAHPLVAEWTARIGELEGRFGLDLKAKVRPDVEDDEPASS